MPLDATPMKFLVTVMPGFTKLSVLYSKQESITPQPSLFYRFYGLMPPASFSARPPRGRHKNHALFLIFLCFGSFLLPELESN